MTGHLLNVGDLALKALTSGFRRIRSRIAYARFQAATRRAERRAIATQDIGLIRAKRRATVHAALRGNQ